MTSFDELPAEIQLHILEQYPETLRSSREIGPYYKNLMEKEYYEEFCERPITIQEFRHYLKTEPNNFSIFFKYEDIKPEYRKIFFPNFSNNEVLDGLFSVKFSLRLLENLTYHASLKTDLFFIQSSNMRSLIYKNQIVISVDRIISLDDYLKGLITIQFDLKTMTNIYKRRLSCLTINSIYVYDMLVSYFEDLITRYNEYDPIKQLKLNLYLRENYIMLNLKNIKIINRNRLNDIEFRYGINNINAENDLMSNSLMDKIMQQNEKMIQLIYEYIKSL